MDKTQESPSTETNAKQTIIHSNSVPVSNIDDVITELNSAENNEKDQKVSGFTDTGANTAKCCTVEEEKTLTASQPSHPSHLDFSALDVDNNPCHFPLGKTFLNSYSRNFSAIADDIDPVGKEHGEKPGMYSLLDDSDSESDSATDSAVKAEKTQGQREDPQDTDEEEVELCFNAISLPAVSRSEGFSLTHERTLISTDLHSPLSLPTLDKDSQENSLSISSDAHLNGDTRHVSTKQEVMCASTVSLNCKTDEKCETTPEPVKPCQTPAGVSCPQSNRHVTPRSQERTAKLRSAASLSPEKPNTVHAPLRSTVSEPKASNNTNGKSSEQVSTTQATRDKEKEKAIPDSKPSLSQTQNKSTRSLGTKSSNDNPASPLLRNKLKPDDKKSNSTSKLKGLSIKSKCKEQEQSVTRSPRMESPAQKKALSSPSQSPKLHARRTTPTGSPKSSRTSEKTRVSCKTDPSPQNTSSALKANPTVNDKLVKPTKEELISDQKEQISKPEATVNSTQRTFIEVRLSSSSLPSSSPSTPVLTHKEVMHASHPSSVDHVECENSHLGVQMVLLDSTSSSSNPLQQNGTNTRNETAEKVYCNGLEETIRNSNNKDAASSLKASTSKLYLRGLDRRSYSIDAREPNPFSVRQRIQSFENLASFDGSVVRCIDVPCYAINSKPPLNRRLSGYTVSAQSSDSRSLRRSLSSCVDNLNSVPSPLHQQQNSSISSFISNSESAPLNGTTEPVMKELGRNGSSQNQPTVHTPPVLRSRNARAHGGLSRSKLREIRALSMPELDKLCTEDFSSDSGKVIFKTELEIHPRRSVEPAGLNAQCTVLTRVSSGAVGSTSNAEQDESQATRLSCWSVR